MERLLINRFIIAFILYLLTSCNWANREQQKTELMGKAEQFWVDFSSAMKSDDTRYLIKHSLDSVQCGNCQLASEDNSEFYKADFLFNNHLDQFKPTENFQEYAIHNDEGIYRVNYKIKWKEAPEGAYNVIYNFIETAEGFKFQGMFSVP